MNVFTPIAIVAAVAASGCTPPPAAGPSGPAGPRSVTLDDVRSAGIDGRLGVPMGTLIVVAGTVVPNTSRAKVDTGEPFFLRITTVDGKPLASPVEYPLRTAHESVAVPELKIGEAFQLRGFETGGYEGVPLNCGASWQSLGFYFVTEFLVLPAKAGA